MPSISLRLQTPYQIKAGSAKFSLSFIRDYFAVHCLKKKEMEMKKIACAILFAAASVSAVMADEVAAPAPSPASGAVVSLPVAGSLVGASLASFIALYLQ
ncbi:hypothetical protein DKX38_024827 [Salix brachista]|uniref:Arabinogalactan peptide 23-like n=1 Tax=Salix brachista TaxID=2182728 RepID=A0A5N5JMF2_9ROSI|nr:hypothetical protein DKX38_024827 [Salix brachista]